MKKVKTTDITTTALLSAVALVLSYIEMTLPDLPFVIPGMKLGLSNIVTMFALFAINIWSALAICIVKAVFALVTRGMTAALMSLCGAILSTLAMYIVLKFDCFGFIGVGVCGAFCHNLGQILVAFVLTDSTVFAYLFVLGLVSIVTGSITAFVVYIILPKILSLKLHQ